MPVAHGDTPSLVCVSAASGGLDAYQTNSCSRSSTDKSFFQSQQSCVDGYNHRACVHQHRTRGGGEQHAPGVQRAGRQRDGDDVLARGPDQVLDYLPIGGTGKLYDGHDIQRIAPHQNHVSGFYRHIGTVANGNACIRLPSAGASFTVQAF
jgi:hypothetical protein